MRAGHVQRTSGRPSGTLSSVYPEARQALDMNAACSYWISCRRRVREQLVVWDPTHTDEHGSRLGAILPQVVTAGTVTRRAVEATWMTARCAAAHVRSRGGESISRQGGGARRSRSCRVRRWARLRW